MLASKGLQLGDSLPLPSSVSVTPSVGDFSNDFINAAQYNVCIMQSAQQKMSYNCELSESQILTFVLGFLIPYRLVRSRAQVQSSKVLNFVPSTALTVPLALTNRTHRVPHGKASQNRD